MPRELNQNKKQPYAVEVGRKTKPWGVERERKLHNLWKNKVSFNEIQNTFPEYTPKRIKAKMTRMGLSLCELRKEVA